MITVLLDEIKAQLMANLGGNVAELSIDSFPASPEEYRRYSKSAILPRFVGLSATTQGTYAYQIEVAVISRKLNSDGIYPLVELVESTLTGWKPSKVGVSSLTLNGVRFVNYDGGVWMYALDYTINAVRRQ